MMFGPFYRVNIPTRNASRLLCMSNQVQNQNPFKATTTGKQSKTKLVFRIAVVLKRDRMLSRDIPIVIPVRYGRPSIMLTSMGQK